jgi:hypothetical protein
MHFAAAISNCVDDTSSTEALKSIPVSRALTILRMVDRDDGIQNLRFADR